VLKPLSEKPGLAARVTAGACQDYQASGSSRGPQLFEPQLGCSLIAALEAG
jgi:hypothetical protein